MILFDQIKRLYGKEQNIWNYYDEYLPDIYSEEFAKTFILNYFAHGGKEFVVAEVINDLDTTRLIHTVSVFFLGILIKQELCPDLKLIDENGESYDFSYLWFLVCLYHDVGYVVENDWTYKYRYREKTEKFLQENKNILKCFCKHIIKNKYFGVAFGIPCLFKNITSTIRKTVYSRKTILNYLEYCKMDEKLKHYDHGIFGGVWLYDGLIKNHILQYKAAKENNAKATFHKFDNNGLTFSENYFKVYEYLADCIIAHNIWPANNSSNEKYINCGLSELSVEKFTPICFQKNPILFILALADSIEPIKVFVEQKLEPIYIWTKINIEIEQRCIELCLCDEKMDFEKYSKKVLGLNGWLDVKVDVNKDKKIIRIEW